MLAVLSIFWLLY